MLTRKASDDAAAGVRWESDGGGEYAIETVERPVHGTEVVLHLKEAAKEFLDSWSLRSLITRYSDHIGFPIRMRDDSPSDSESDSEDGEGEWQDVNRASALWTKSWES